MSVPGSIAYHRDLTPFEERLIEENRALRDHAGGEPYATRLWHEVERLRAQVQAVEALCDEAAFTIALRMADGFITYPKVVTVPKLRAALAVPAATGEGEVHGG